MVACEPVIRVVGGTSHLVEQVADFARDDALVLQAPQQIGLFLVWRREQTHVRRGKLRQQLGQLAQLQQAGVGILCEGTFSKLPKRTSCSSCT